MEWQIPLLVSAIVFAAFLIFRMRPAVTAGGRASAAALVEAKKRLDAAQDDASRAAALTDAGDASVLLGRVNGAVGFYTRALRLAPTSPQIVHRAATALARRPGALEKLLWRSLAETTWTGEGRAAATVALRALAELYGRKPRTRLRAKAIEHALASLTSAESA